MGAALSPQSTKLRLSSSSTQRRVLLIVFVVQAGPLSPPTATCARARCPLLGSERGRPLWTVPRGQCGDQASAAALPLRPGNCPLSHSSRGRAVLLLGPQATLGLVRLDQFRQGLPAGPDPPRSLCLVREPLLGSRAWLTLPLPSPSSSTGLTVGAQRDATLGQPLSVTP